MLGAIIGDIVGSTREWHNVKTTRFKLLPKGSTFTDDTVMTLAVAKWLLDDPSHSPDSLVRIMQELGRKYPNVGYGKRFKEWLMSDNPQPYGSWGNGSAMRVSPVGLYANSLEEALELAKISASVTHNHPEGIKGAQAIAACVYMRRQDRHLDFRQLKKYLEDNFGYDLSADLKDLREDYKYDVSCQGSVPIAIMSYLQAFSDWDCLRLAISMGGDSDTIGDMTAAIAFTGSRGSVSNYCDEEEMVLSECRNILTPELLDINDRFEHFINFPLEKSYSLFRNSYVGEYPGLGDINLTKTRINQLLHFGVRYFIDLTQENECVPYRDLLPSECTYIRFPIQKGGVPENFDDVENLVKKIYDFQNNKNGCVYIHSADGLGRAAVINACCWDIESFDNIMDAIRECYYNLSWLDCHNIFKTKLQEDFVRNYVATYRERKRKSDDHIRDCIRGCLMGGAAGAALGFAVERMNANEIKFIYGKNGITKFVLNYHGKALLNCDAQMMLYTANGMLMGITRGCIRGIGGIPEDYVEYAYQDWYSTQSVDSDKPKYKHTWLRDLPEMAFSRSPGVTCLRAIEFIINKEEPNNNSKGCAGIVRVAPLALLMAAAKGPYSPGRMAEAGAKIARVTHRNPLGYIPAGLFTVFVYRLVPLTPEVAKATICGIVNECLDVMMNMYGDEFAEEKSYLRDLTLRAVDLARSNVPDIEAISELGDGWVAEETWAIALFCSLRHIDSIKDAIVSAVNNNGHSDSIALLTGNIMGAIYGYDCIKSQNLFCPEDTTFEQTLELSNVILALADDLFTGCIINEYDCDNTPEKKQWFNRYWEMKPAGI